MNFEILKNFIVLHGIANRLNLPEDEVEEFFLDYIDSEIAIGHSAGDVAAMVLLTLSGIADCRHNKEQTKYEAVTDLTEQLEDVILRWKSAQG